MASTATEDHGTLKDITWDDYVKEMRARFHSNEFEDPMSALVSLKQTATVEEFYKRSYDIPITHESHFLALFTEVHTWCFLMISLCTLTLGLVTCNIFGRFELLLQHQCRDS